MSTRLSAFPFDVTRRHPPEGETVLEVTSALVTRPGPLMDTEPATSGVMEKARPAPWQSRVALCRLNVQSLASV